jgi:hypothetical protein
MLDLEGYIFSCLKGNAARASVTYIEKGLSYYSSSF